MRFFVNSFLFFAKRQLKSIAFVLLLVAVPVAVVVCSSFSSFREPGREKVMIYSQANDSSSRRIIEGLLNLNTEFEFVVAESEDELVEQVKARKALCGYVIKDKLEDKLKQKKYAGNVQLVLRQNSTLSDAANEQFYSMYLREMTYTYALDIIEKSTGVTEQTPGFDIRRDFENYMSRDENGFLNIVFLDETPIFDTITSEGSLIFSVPAIMAVLMLLAGFMGLGTFINDGKKGTLSPMRRSNSLEFRILYCAVPVVLMGISTAVTVCCTRGISLRVPLSVFAYALMLVALFFVLSFIVREVEVLIALEVILILGSLVFCPVFFDLSFFFKPISILRNFMPAQWFLSLLG